MIWSTRPSVTTCFPTHGKRCRRPEPGHDFLLVNTHSHMRAEIPCITIFGLVGIRMGWQGHDLPPADVIDPEHIASVYAPINSHPVFIVYHNKVTQRSGLHKEILTCHCIVLILAHNRKINDLELHNVSVLKYLNVHKGNMSYINDQFFFPQSNKQLPEPSLIEIAMKR